MGRAWLVKLGEIAFLGMQTPGAGGKRPSCDTEMGPKGFSSGVGAKRVLHLGV